MTVSRRVRRARALGLTLLLLLLVFALLVYLPYSKLAHMLYRTVAMAYAERMGRGRVVPPDGSEEPEGEGPAEEGEEPTEDSP